jgi:cation diffusion facilitator family transporter
MNKKTQENLAIAKRISTVSVLWNVVLSVIKILAGVLGHSGAMIADGVHSISDVLTTVLAYIGIKMASKSADEDHPYGHEKIEPVMGKLLAIILFLTAAGIMYGGVQSILSGEVEPPKGIAIYAAILSIIIKEWMFHYTISGARKINSGALKADAWHHRTDALSSVGSLVGIGAAMMGYPLMDPIAGIAIGMLVMKVAVDIYIQSVKELIDTSADKETVEELRSSILSVEGVCCVDDLKTRMHANRLYVDVEVSVDGNLKLIDAHEIAEQVHQTIEEEFDQVKHCMVHVNPWQAKQ